MKRYTGDRTIDGIEVLVDGQPLDPRTDIAEICDAGFEWSYEGDGPEQLALAILADHLGDPGRARKLSGAFMRTIVANFNNEWELTSTDVANSVSALEAR
jgi:Family of unknown function (DUF6166)